MSIETNQIKFLSNQNQIKAYIHPVRIAILERLVREQRTVSSIARELGVHPANITHHFRILEKANLIRLVEKKDTGRNLEKYYRALARDFIVKPDSSTKIGRRALALSVLKENLSSAIPHIRDDEKKAIAMLITARVNPVDIESFIQGLKKLIKDFSQLDGPDGDVYTLNVSMYPQEGNVVPEKTVLIE